MVNKKTSDCQTPGAWQLEIALIDLHIRQLQAEIREQQAVINLLKAQRRDIMDAHHKKRRRCRWDADTPMIRLVNLQQLEYFRTLISDWQKRATDAIDITKTSQFTFQNKLKWHAIHALAVVLTKDPPVFKVSTRDLCRYLSTHSNLGSPEAIKKALQRVKNTIKNHATKSGDTK